MRKSTYSTIDGVNYLYLDKPISWKEIQYKGSPILCTKPGILVYRAYRIPKAFRKEFGDFLSESEQGLLHFSRLEYNSDDDWPTDIEHLGHPGRSLGPGPGKHQWTVQV